MSKRDLRLYIEDILESIEAIENYIININSFDDFANDRKTYSATIREYIIIGEAILPLIELLENKFPNYEWRMIKDFRNSIVHGYFGIDLDEVWNIITEKLEILRVDLTLIVKDNINLEEAILCEIEEYKNLNDINIVKYLMQL